MSHVTLPLHPAASKANIELYLAPHLRGLRLRVAVWFISIKVLACMDKSEESSYVSIQILAGYFGPGHKRQDKDQRMVDTSL